jgi:hypothetical protein
LKRRRLYSINQHSRQRPVAFLALIIILAHLGLMHFDSGGSDGIIALASFVAYNTL